MAEKKLITSITPEQEAQIPVYLNKYIDAVVKGQYYKNFTYEGAKALVDWQYDFAGFAKPMTIVANNPMEAQMINAYLMENYPKEIDKYLEETDEAKKEKLYKKVLALIKKAKLKIPSSFADNYLFTSDVYTNVLIGWWGYLIDVLKLESEINETFFKWRDLYENSGVYNTICNDKVCIVSKYPREIHRNEAGDLHRTDGQAVVWDGIEWKCYYINGRNIPSKDFELALEGNITGAKFSKETNEDVRAAWYEILGQEKMIEILGASEVDRGSIVHGDGSIEELVLYKTKKRFPETGNEPFAWIRFICPSTGTNYLIDVEPKWKTALEAAVSTSPFEMDINDYKFDGRA